MLIKIFKDINSDAMITNRNDILLGILTLWLRSIIVLGKNISELYMLDGEV